MTAEMVKKRGGRVTGAKQEATPCLQKSKINSQTTAVEARALLLTRH